MEYRKKESLKLSKCQTWMCKLLCCMREMSLVLLLSQGCCRFRPILFPSWQESVSFGWCPGVCCQRGCSPCRGVPCCACWCTAGLPVLRKFSTAVCLCTKQDVCQFCCSYFVWLITFPMFLLGLGCFLSVSCQNFNVSFSSVKVFLLVAGS